MQVNFEGQRFVSFCSLWSGLSALSVRVTDELNLTCVERFRGWAFLTSKVTTSVRKA